MAFTQTSKSKSIAIIGGGFCGVLTAIHLLRDDRASQLQIYLINKGHILAKGIAYDPHTQNLLLNVPSSRMSALPEIPHHYTDWLQAQYPNKPYAEFSTRRDYGNYLTWLWEDTVTAAGPNKTIMVYHDYADDITCGDRGLDIRLRDNTVLTAHTVILATGNGQPRSPTGISKEFEKSRYYFADPWHGACLQNTTGEGAVLMIGAGLTTVDTVIGLIENNCTETIHTISPNGYRLKTWREEKEPYTAFSITGITSGKPTLLHLLRSFNRHRKLAAGLNQSVYPLVDAFRPHTQKLWQQFSLQEKQQFIKYLKPFWEKVRHRLPGEQYKKMEDLRAAGKLISHKGRIVSVTEAGGKAIVTLCVDGKPYHINCKKIINCTGPETDIKKLNDPLLNNLLQKGWISPGPCGLGIDTNPLDHRVTTADHLSAHNLYVIGNHLKGTLWESTAVPELRLQAKTLADEVLAAMFNASIKAG